MGRTATQGRPAGRPDSPGPAYRTPAHPLSTAEPPTCGQLPDGLCSPAACGTGGSETASPKVCLGRAVARANGARVMLGRCTVSGRPACPLLLAAKMKSCMLGAHCLHIPASQALIAHSTRSQSVRRPAWTPWRQPQHRPRRQLLSVAWLRLARDPAAPDSHAGDQTSFSGSRGHGGRRGAAPAPGPPRFGAAPPDTRKQGAHVVVGGGR